jgi:hypothetical protein
MDKRRWVPTISAAIAVATLLTFFTFSFPQSGLSQSRQLKDDMAQLAVDLHAGLDRSTLTEQQKAQLHNDFKELRRARENHEKFAAMQSARRIRETLDSGAFKPEDRERIKQDMQAIRDIQGESSGDSGRMGLFRRFNR